jgi:hypothetical protein
MRYETTQLEEGDIDLFNVLAGDPELYHEWDQTQKELNRVIDRIEYLRRKAKKKSSSEREK